MVGQKLFQEPLSFCSIGGKAQTDNHETLESLARHRCIKIHPKTHSDFDRLIEISEPLQALAHLEFAVFLMALIGVRSFGVRTDVKWPRNRIPQYFEDLRPIGISHQNKAVGQDFGASRLTP